MTPSLQFDAVAEDHAGPKWAARWARSWPAYEAWFVARGGDAGPSRADCRTALAQHMPELVPVHARLTALAGGSDRAARFLSTWCPPPYLGGCSIAALGHGDDLRLVRNYDLSPDLNEGLLLHSRWTGKKVMGMVEFLWGLSDGINEDGLCIALAFGGSSRVAPGFGITTIVRYVLETCSTVSQALPVLDRVPSHMAYNLVLADRTGNRAGVEMIPGGGAMRTPLAVATNHQLAGDAPDRPGFTATHPRHAGLSTLIGEVDGTVPVAAAIDRFLAPGLYQSGHAGGFGTLFTAVYDPGRAAMALRWPGQTWSQTIGDFVDGTRLIRYAAPVAEPVTAPAFTPSCEPQYPVPGADVDWEAFGRACADVACWSSDTWRRLLATRCSPCA